MSYKSNRITELKKKLSLGGDYLKSPQFHVRCGGFLNMQIHLNDSNPFIFFHVDRLLLYKFIRVNVSASGKLLRSIYLGEEHHPCWTGYRRHLDLHCFEQPNDTLTIRVGIDRVHCHIPPCYSE